jgi:hypothetical protein
LIAAGLVVFGGRAARNGEFHQTATVSPPRGTAV